MSVIGDLLFYPGQNGHSLNDVTRHKSTKVLQEMVSRISPEQLAAKGVEETVSNIVSELQIEPLELDPSNGEADIKEISVSGTNNWGEHYNAPGLRIIKKYPFDGDPELFKVYASSFSMNSPRGDVSRKFLTIGMEVPAGRKQTAIDHIKSTLSDIQQYIQQQYEPIEIFNKNLENIVKPAVLARQATFSEIDDLKKSLDDI